MLRERRTTLTRDKNIARAGWLAGWLAGFLCLSLLPRTPPPKPPHTLVYYRPGFKKAYATLQQNNS